ncbi:hypothetical protein [Phycisphaera mikurensis]|uniref:PilZ domain-containing protein n=1 Tax=Phycisphaera mikurensis (strain NBRC 102666 / KCTC 22515 / FYK2301M01) TaxID=1142394 RepID=I0IB51_PHYMF|nr:hypothetical protein [Phycisphaera mikurensis]MBB6442990.1 hypothetical protein [Phycisphaera mikurensis]BAM02489.1 hypothetical protein PSMK_03300 [Phycisphaera mikurensis NBRC 102666]
MLSLREPPDFTRLQAEAERLADNEASSLPPNRRRDARRPVRGVVLAGTIPGPCERLTLGRIPVSVFKPAWGGWAVDLAVSGMAIVTERRLPQADRWWLRLDDFATRPTILPAFVAGCRPLESLAGEPGAAASPGEGLAAPAGAPLYRIRFKFQISQAGLARRLRLDEWEASLTDRAPEAAAA